MRTSTPSFPFSPQDHLLIPEPGADFGHIAKPHPPPLGLAHDHRADPLQGVQFVEGADQVTSLVLVHAAAGEVHIALVEGARHFLDPDPVGGEAALVHIHLDLAGQPALDPHRRDPGDSVEVLLQILFGPLPDRREGEIARDAEANDGVRGRVEAEQPRPLGVFRKNDAVQLLADIEPGEVHVRVPDELESDFRGTGPRAGGDPAEAGDHRGRLLDRAGHQGFDLDRGGPRHPGLDGERRVGDLREQVQRQPAEGDQPEDARRHREHGDAHRAPDAARDERLHGARLRRSFLDGRVRSRPGPRRAPRHRAPPVRPPPPAPRPRAPREVRGAPLPGSPSRSRRSPAAAPPGRPRR